MARTSLPSCTKIPAQYTWMKGGLTGYYYNNKWFPRYCNKPERLNLQKCLKNQRLILFGDSTVRYWYKYLMDHLTCMSVTEHWAKEKWHKRSSCVIKRLNFTMEWKPHAQPFNVGSQWDTKRYTTHSIANHIEGLASSADVIIVIHMFSHLNNYHMSVFRDRMRVISKSVKRFLMRNRNAKVFIKGPHTHKLIGSMFSHVYRDIIREEFNESLDDVYYLDQAAMTLAKGNVDVHPATDIVREAVKQMLGFICV